MVTLRVVPYSEIEKLSSLGRIKKLLSIAKEDKIVLLQGRLKREEEKELIKTTMEEINEEFRGIELAVINPTATKNSDMLEKVKDNLMSTILGDRQGLTIIGPATIVKKIKKDPSKIELFTREPSRKRKR